MWPQRAALGRETNTFSMSLLSLNRLESLDAAARRRRLGSSVLSVVISFLVVALMLAVLAAVLLPSWVDHAEPVTAYVAPQQPDKPIESRRFSPRTSKPSSPSSALARVIAVNTRSPVSIPVPEVLVSDDSAAFGSGDDFGEGWEDGEGDGFGTGGGTTFFEQKVRAQRVAYVIDYSLSMTGRREQLMRDELARSVGRLTPGMKHQLVFFAGPAWIAGDEVSVADDRRAGEVDDGQRSYDWEVDPSDGSWQPRGLKQRPEWRDCSPGTIADSVDKVRRGPLAWGTSWEAPLEMAIAMNPAPQVIFFMTDGAVGGDMVKLAEKLGHRARRKGILVNTVAMMQPEAEDAMKELAKRSGGQFSIIREDGSVEVVPVE